MDNFREWLSDNLRYILLGLGIIVVLVVLFFGVRFLSSVFADDKDPVQVVEEPKEEDGEEKEPEEQQPETTPEATATPEPEQESDVDMLKEEQYPQVHALMENYYTALGNGDTASLKTLVDQLDPEEEQAIANSHMIERYSNVKAYTKKGLTENSYVVFATYGHKYVDYNTVLPGMSCLYVDTKEDGSLYVVAQPTQEQQDRMDEATQESDVQELVTATQQAYDQALAQDTELAAYLEELFQ